MKYELYKWQEDCLGKWEENNHQGIINVVTGAGKTFLAISAIEKVLDDKLRVKIIVPTINLLFQWKKEIIKTFEKEYEDNVALHYSGNNKDNDVIFSIYVVNSARHTISKAIIDDMNKGYKVMLIADEAHHYLSNENKKVFHYLLSKSFKKENFYSLGLSATIDEDGLKETLIPALGEVIYTLDHKEALEDNVISPFAIFETSISFKPIERADYDEVTLHIENLYRKIKKKYLFLNEIKDRKLFLKALSALAKDDEEVDIYKKLLFKRKKISSTSTTRIACGVEIVKKLYDKKVIVFAERIAQIKQFEKQLKKEGINKVACYHSKQSIDYRRRILQDYKEGEINVLLTCKALDEGVDVPDAEVAIVLSSSSVSRQRIQRLGRVLRKNDDKQMASLFYLYLSDANDDALYLEELYRGDNKIMRLHFSDADKSFTNDQYEKKALSFYKTLGGQKDKELLIEYNRCLDKGMLRTDWLLSLEELDDKVKQSKTTAEKNYYVVMKKMMNSVQHNNI